MSFINPAYACSMLSWKMWENVTFKHLQILLYSRSLSTGSRSTGSGGATPIRKISAQEFEKGGLTKPWVTTVDGTPTFLTQVQEDDDVYIIDDDDSNDCLDPEPQQQRVPDWADPEEVPH